MTTASEKEIKSFVEEVYRHGCCDHRGQKAIMSIAEIGEPTIPVVVSVMKNRPKSDLHGRDLAESIQAIFTCLAGTAPDALIDLMERDSDTQSLVVWGLGNAKGRRSIDVLVVALKDKNMWLRWAAVESLIRRRSKRAVDPPYHL